MGKQNKATSVSRLAAGGPNSDPRPPPLPSRTVHTRTVLVHTNSTHDDDAEKRVQLLQKANALLFDEAPIWFFNYNKAVMAVQPWLKGIQLDATELTHQNVEDLWVDETSPAK